MLLIAIQMEVTLTLLSEVTGMILTKQDSHVLHTTSISATTSMLSMPADSTVTHGHVSSHMSNLSQSCDHF